MSGIIAPVVEKEFEYKGFPCVVLMQAMGFRTAYVGVPKNHPVYGKYYGDLDIDCHGGLTYAEDHLVHQDRADTWWIGFDTAHHGDGYDYKSATELFKGNPEALKQMEILKEISQYRGFPARSLEYCEEQCRHIVDQII